MSCFASIFSTVLLLLAGSSMASVSDHIWVLTHPEPPMISVDEFGHTSGYAVDLVRNILAEADIQQDILTAPWARVEQEARTKPNVLAFALARTPDREHAFHWITPITANVHGIYANADSGLSMQHISEVNRLGTVGVLRGDVRHEVLRSYGAKTVPFNTWKQAVGALLKNRISAIFFSEVGLTLFCQRLKEDCAEIRRIYVHKVIESYLVLSNKGTDPQLAARLRLAAERVKAKTEFTYLANYWIDRNLRNGGMPMHFHQGVINLWHKYAQDNTGIDNKRQTLEATDKRRP